MLLGPHNQLRNFRHQKLRDIILGQIRHGFARGDWPLFDDAPVRWAREHRHIRYRRALSEDGSGGIDCFEGQVHEAVLADHRSLSGYDVYLAGPPAMIDAAKTSFLAAGLDKDRLFYDSFEFGVDVPVRVLARPH